MSASILLLLCSVQQYSPLPVTSALRARRGDGYFMQLHLQMVLFRSLESFFQETYGPGILQNKAQKIRKEIGNHEFKIELKHPQRTLMNTR